MSSVYITTGFGVTTHMPSLRRPGREYGTCDEALRSKPEIYIYNRTADEIAKLCTSIHTGNAINLKDYVGVLAYLLEEYCKDICPDEFKPCNLEVGSPGVPMTPLDFLQKKIIAGDAPAVDDAAPMIEKSQRLSLLVRMLAAHRIQAAEEVQDKDKAYAKKIANQVRTAVGRIGIRLEGDRLVHSERFAILTEYMRLLSAADMFFIKFPKNDYASFKVGTLTMAFKDMSQMNNCLYLSALTGQPWEVVIFYIFEKSVANELSAIVPGQWWSEIFYFAYQSSMGLLGGKFTYYSNTKNPKLHNVIQLTGMMMGSPRAFNAYYMESPNAIQIGQALFMIMASTGEGGYIKAIYDAKDDAEEFDASISGNDSTMTPSARASKFLAEIPKNATEYTEAATRMLRAAKRAAGNLHVTREKSFGKWVKEIDVESLTEALYEKMTETGRGAKSVKGESSDEESDESDSD